ncbi:MAG: regulatory protein RecX [Cellulomonadaceae bacterium]
MSAPGTPGAANEPYDGAADRAATIRRLRGLLEGAASEARTGRGAAGGQVPDLGVARDHDAAPESDPNLEERARTYLLRSLTAASRTRAQLARGLADRDVPAALAAALLDRFEEVGLIDDADYAQRLARSRHAERGLSRRAIAVELRRKGLGDAQVSEAVGQIDTGMEEDVARSLVRARLGRMGGLADDVRIRRLGAMLGRKGYPGELAMRVVREELRRANGANPP